MTDALRVILEIGKKRRVVAGAMDWPGLDRWGTSEDDALGKLSSYLPRYAGVAERAGLGSAFARARDMKVVERVPGSSSTDFWGIAHVPSQIERDVPSPADLEQRLDLGVGSVRSRERQPSPGPADRAGARELGRAAEPLAGGEIGAGRPSRQPAPLLPVASEPVRTLGSAFSACEAASQPYAS